MNPWILRSLFVVFVLHGLQRRSLHTGILVHDAILPKLLCRYHRLFR